MTRRLLLTALVTAAALAAIAPIRNYDFFWHLATGRWILEHRALPLTDPFAVASDRVPWINGEWLFEVIAWMVHRAIGTNGMSVLRGWLAALIWSAVTAAAAAASRRRRNGEASAADGDDAGGAMLLGALSFAGAMVLFDFRPASIAAIFVIVALTAESPLAHAINSVVWINMHPSAVLAPLLAALRTRKPAPAIASALALLVNPFGIRGILAPIELTLFARSGEFVNAEWLPSPIRLFPLLYLCVAIGVATFARNGDWREQWWRAAAFALFAYLAVRHVRNQPLFFAAFPILVAPAIRRVPRALAYATVALALLFVGFTGDRRLGIAPERFPIHAVARLKSTALPGNIYNADQFGGFLIDAFYPQRRTLTDGRNELYRTYLREYSRARRDERAWRALLAKYRVDLAVEEYLPALPVTDAVTGKTVPMAASLAYWPRNDWALIGYDRAAMLFARRAAFPRDVIERWEVEGIVPDAPPRR